MLSCPAHFGYKKMSCFVVCSCLVAPNAQIMLEGLQVVLGLLTCKGQHVGTPKFAGTITHCWIGGLDHDQWTLPLGYLYVQMVAMLFSPVSIV